MVTKDTIEEFFEDQFRNTSQFFLYKDRQLLEKGKYREFALEQISKASKSFWSVTSSVFICSYWGIISFIEYGAGPNLFDLTFGLIAWLAIIGILFYSAKEYFTIKSSMFLLMKLLDKMEIESAA